MRLAVLIPAALAALAPITAEAIGLTARHDLAAGTIIAESDIAVDLTRDGGFDHPRQAIGRQLRRTVHAGREVPTNALITPILIGRNQLVTLIFARGGLTIETQARALEAGAAGDSIRALNLSSRATVSALVRPDGSLAVQPQP